AYSIIDSLFQLIMVLLILFFFSSRRRHTRCYRDWSSDVCSSDLMSSATPATIAKPAISPMIAASVTGGDSKANTDATTLRTPNRSEERRVGKEGGCGRAGEE